VALRIARAATGRNRVVKFRGHYHGWLDPAHVAVPANMQGAGTAGQDPAASTSVTVCDWADLTALDAVLGSDVAAVIVEPVPVNGGCFLPADGYLEGVRALAATCGAVLIFDEVITGFRVSLGGAQERLNVTPDLTILGKALGAGFPISAVCGRAELMDVVASSRVAHVGTFNANPISAAAAVAALSLLERDAAHIYPTLNQRMQELADGMATRAAETGLPIVVNALGGAAHAFVSTTPVTGFDQLASTDAETYRRFAEALLAEGVHVVPRGLLYVSTQHTDEDLALTLEAVSRAAERVAVGAKLAPTESHGRS
jgi:glutamate-1-semialdehyde 2,1-aminomutase